MINRFMWRCLSCRPNGTDIGVELKHLTFRIKQARKQAVRINLTIHHTDNSEQPHRHLPWVSFQNRIKFPIISYQVPNHINKYIYGLWHVTYLYIPCTVLFPRQPITFSPVSHSYGYCLTNTYHNVITKIRRKSPLVKIELVGAPDTASILF